MAHKKGLGSSRNGRDSNGQRRGVKVYGGQRVAARAWARDGISPCSRSVMVLCSSAERARKLSVP